jgi:glycosyltransferase involved in cell wall biosynthesis
MTITTPDPRRILILNSARKWIGEAAHSVAMAETLLARGHHAILGLRAGFEPEQRVRKAGLPYEPFIMNSRFTGYHDLCDIFHLRRLVRRERIDLIICNRGKDHWLTAGARAFGMRAPILRFRHVVTHMHQHLANGALFRFATNGVVCVSDAAKASLGTYAASVGPKRRPARVIYSSVDSEKFNPSNRNQATRDALGIKASDVLITLIARFQRIKGQEYFLKIAAALHQRCPNTRFLMAGRGSQNLIDKYWAQADALGLPREALRIEGWLPNLPEVMASCDIGTVTSLGSEGSSRASLEYMASGIPVVATRVGGIPEILRDGVEGYLTEPRAVEEMVDKLESLVKDSALRSHMGAAGRHEAETRFHPERWMSELEAEFAENL